jgi:hypothetical protein
MSQITEDSYRWNRHESNLLAIPDASFSLLTVDEELERAIRTRQWFLSMDDRPAVILGRETPS